MKSSPKSLDDLNADMSALYDKLNEGGVDLKVAQELANIGGKLLKIQALMWAKEVFATDPRTAAASRNKLPPASSTGADGASKT